MKAKINTMRCLLQTSLELTMEGRALPFVWQSPLLVAETLVVS